VAVASSGRVYVAEPRSSTGAGRVEVFDRSGALLGELGSGLRSPRSFAIDGADRVYVAEWDGTVRRFLPDGSEDPGFRFESPMGTNPYLFPSSVVVSRDRLLVASSPGVTVHRLDGSLERSLGVGGNEIVGDGPDHSSPSGGWNCGATVSMGSWLVAIPSIDVARWASMSTRRAC